MANKKQQVWVASFRFEDRHGESGSDILGVYSISSDNPEHTRNRRGGSRNLNELRE